MFINFLFFFKKVGSLRSLQVFKIEYSIPPNLEKYTKRFNILEKDSCWNPKLIRDKQKYMVDWKSGYISSKYSLLIMLLVWSLINLIKRSTRLSFLSMSETDKSLFRKIIISSCSKFVSAELAFLLRTYN